MTLVHFDVDERGVATLALDDMATRNALTEELLDELIAHLEHMRTDPRVRCVVLTSAHPTVFSSGGDLKMFRAETPIVEKFGAIDRLPRIFRLLGELGKPVITKANGDVLAGALGLALATDLVVAHDGVRFGTPEINIGAFPYVISALIYRNVPRKATNELLLLGDLISASDAHRLGIVNRVVTKDRLDAVVDDWAGRLAAKSPVLMKMGKDAVFRQMDMPLVDALEYLRGQLALTFSTSDLHEGVEAFFEKRDPVWTGR